MTCVMSTQTSAVSTQDAFECACNYVGDHPVGHALPRQSMPVSLRRSGRQPTARRYRTPLTGMHLKRGSETRPAWVGPLHCVTSKQHRLKFNTSSSRSKTILELVHSDVWQTPVTSLGGAKYFVSFIDDYSRRCWEYPIKKKADVFSVFKAYKARVELES